MIYFIFPLTIYILLALIFFILFFIEDEPIFLIFSFFSLLLSFGLILCFNNLVKSSIKEQPTREVDYNIILIPFDKVEITDKHGNRDTIQFDSLQQYIEQDNI